MNEQPLSDELIDQLIDGTADAAQVPADLQSVGALLSSAHGPATAAELSGMAAMVQQFTATVLDPTTTPALTPSRRPRMFATRITRRAAAVVAVTLLAAGTAAAAAGGALPDVFSSDDPSIAADTSDVDTTDVSDSIDVTDTSLDDEATDDSTPGPDAAGEAAHGLCEAYLNHGDDHGGQSDNSNGHSDDNPSVTNPVSAALEQAADDAGVTVDEYCTDVIAAHEAEHADDADDDDSTDSTIDDDEGDDSGRAPVTTAGRDDHPSGSDSGSGRSGSGSSGSGSSNSGRGGSGDSAETENAG